MLRQKSLESVARDVELVARSAFLSRPERRIARSAFLPLRTRHSSQARRAHPRVRHSLQRRTPRFLAFSQLLDALQTQKTDKKQPFSAEARHKLSFFPCLIAFYLCLCFLLYELRLGLWTRVELPAMLWFFSQLVAQFREYEARYSIRLRLFFLTNSPHGHQTKRFFFFFFFFQSQQTIQTIQTIQSCEASEASEGRGGHAAAHRRLDASASLSARPSLRFLFALSLPRSFSSRRFARDCSLRPLRSSHPPKSCSSSAFSSF